MNEAQIMRKILATPNKQKQQSKISKCKNYMSDPNCVEKMYQVMDELGSGGFGKVKLALHILTGERVAIKIIDKKAIANDLPRVTSELEALKQLAHQNICRMFQFVETEEKYYIVMEYCNGGEVFDYIIKKERLSESEARHFFRQLVQAVAYIHSMGFAHRDLKPENLLLTQELQLKVIDFGLCAKPLNGLTKPLETCCGSPAYAAPELIQDHFYYGNEADIWSMGVLLYALLCGMLPFDDSNMPRLYKQIMAGIYVEPDYLSPLSRDFLRSMLTVDPKKRATIKQILAHPWLNKNYNQQLKWQTIYSRDVIDEDVLRELVYFYGVGMSEMEERIKEWNFDYLTATYLILLKKKEQKQNFALPFYHETKKLPCSPTIHASLGNDLDFSGVEFDANSSPPTDESDDHPSSVPTEKLNTMSLYVQHMFAHSPQKVEKQANYQNTYQKPKRMIQAGQHQQMVENQQQLKSVYITPRRKPIVVQPLCGGCEIVSPSFYRRPNSVERSRPPPPDLSITPTLSMTTNGQQRTPISSNSIDQPTNTPSDMETPSSTCERVARKDTRTRRANDPEGGKSPNRLRQRVFSSLERKADRMIHLLTPKKIRTDGPTKLKCMKTMVNVSVTSSSDAAKVRDELWKVLRNQGMETTQIGWKICGSKKSETMPTTTTVELEVVSIDGLQYVGVKRKRIRGDAFMYKRICEEVLRLAGL